MMQFKIKIGKISFKILKSLNIVWTYARNNKQLLSDNLVQKQ